MTNAKAVYSSKRSVTAGKLASLASECGMSLRYLQLGGYTFSRYANEVPNKGLTDSLNKALLVVGATTDDSDVLSELDEAIATRDHQWIGDLLNSFQLPWIELYSSPFDYHETMASNPKLEQSISASLQGHELIRVIDARTRHIIYNQSRRKICGHFMKQLSMILAKHVDGIVVTHKRLR